MKNRTTLISASVLAVLGVAAVSAEEQVLDSQAVGSTVSSPSASDVVFEEVVVTAQRRAETLERTPVAVSALTQDELAKQAIASEADLQSAVPGLQVKAGSHSNQLNFAIRGQSLDAFSGVLPGVLPYFNEVQVGSGNSTALYDLQSIQVLKGPQGTLFGRNSTGGTVLFTSAKPAENFGGYVSAQGGNWSLFRGEGALNVPLADGKVLTRFAGYYQTRDGYQYNRFNGQHMGDMDRAAGRFSLTLRPTDTFTNDLVVDYANAEGTSITAVIDNIYAPGSTAAPVPANILFTPALDAVFFPGAWQQYVNANPGVDPDGLVEYTRKQKEKGPYNVSINAPPFHRLNNLVVSNVTTYEINDSLQFKNIIGYTNLRSVNGGEFDGSPYQIDDRGDFGDHTRVEQFSEEPQLIGEALDHKLSYVVGLYFLNEKTTQTALSLIANLDPVMPVARQLNSGETKRESYAGYGQGTYDLSEATGIDDLRVTLGARYTREKVTFTHLPDDVFLQSPHPDYVNPLEDTYDEVSWHAGLERQLHEWLFYVTARSSVRTGGFNFFSPPLPQLGSEGGSAYDVERATDVELGAKFRGQVGGRDARLNLAMYAMEVEDAQRVTYADILGAPSAVTVNVPETRVLGVELDGVINLTDWLNFGGSISYTDAEFTKNDVSVLGGAPVPFGPVPDTPEWAGSAFAEINTWIGSDLKASFRAELYAQTSTFYSSTANFDNPGTEIPGYGLLNLRLGLESGRTGWSWAAVMKNVTDKVYYVGGLGFGSLFSYNMVVPGEPRSYLLEARYSF